jgi:hypothetical protein
VRIQRSEDDLNAVSTFSQMCVCLLLLAAFDKMEDVEHEPTWELKIITAR